MDPRTATADPVSGAFARAALEPWLAAELGRAGRSGEAASLFLFDIDFFKTVNDVYGHLRGDQVLRQLADRVRESVRAHDVLFRYGGDEFVVLLPGTSRADAVALAVRLTEQIATAEFGGQPPLRLSISLGVATYPEDATDPTGLLAVADRRNYLAKRRGRAVAVADDADSGDDDGGSRMWQRDAAVGAVHGYLTELQVHRSGALQVRGQPGAGHTRFLAEVQRLAQMRGFAVMPVPAEPAPLPDPPAGDAPVLLLADLDAGARAPTVLVRWADAGRTPAVVGLAYATTGPSAVNPTLPVLATAELTPWSAGTLRFWLRSVLRGEPSRTLTNWFARQTGGLPAAAFRELERLQARGGLAPDGAGGWTLSTALLGRPRRQVRLPAPITAFVGRDAERRQVASLLTESRLVTLVGPGGIGKTRLSLTVARALADDFEDGAIFVALADCRTTGDVVAAIAQAAGIAEVPDQPLLDSVIGQLAESSLLLVLDNLEQVPDAGPAIGCLLEEAPAVSVLVTSREPLQVYGEQVYRVPALPLPELSRITADEAGVTRVLAESPAVALFDQRARAANSGWLLTAAELPAVAELCHRLDGLPLAIELAAARTDRLRPTELLGHLVGHLEALGDGPRNRPQRQQSLRGAIDWSIELLDPDDRRLFETLGVFAGGFTLAAAYGVAEPDAGRSATAEDDSLALKTLAARLAQLVTKSLLIAESAPDGTPRYRMLQTIQAHAKVRLSLAGAGDRARGRHLAHYVALSTEAAAGMAGPDQAEWAERLRWEYANLRAAMEWALEHGDVAGAGRICMGLWRYWRNGGHIREGREWLHKVLSAPAGLTDQERAQLLYPAAVLAATQDDTDAAARLSRECLDLSGRVGDRQGAARARNILGVTALAVGRPDEAREHFRFSLAVWQDLDEPAGMAIALGNLAKVALRLGEIPAANDDINRCLTLERAAGNSRGVLLGLECLGEILLAKGDLPAARANSAEALALARELGDVFGEAMAQHQSGLVAQAEGNATEALELFLAALERRHEVGDREDLAVSLDSVAQLVVADDPRLAVELLAAVDALRRRLALATPADSGARRPAVLAAARAALGERGFAAAWQAGGTAPLDLVVDRALDSAPTAR